MCIVNITGRDRHDASDTNMHTRTVPVRRHHEVEPAEHG